MLNPSKIINELRRHNKARKRKTKKHSEAGSKYKRISYSQEGEDLILVKLLNFKRKGFYLDVGAHHPFRYSNTALLHHVYGWKGCNIDPLPGMKDLFDQFRPGDINIESGVAEKKQTLTYHHFKPEAYSTFDDQKANALNAQGVELQAVKHIEVMPLSDLLISRDLGNQHIDVVNIDVEGFEDKVLDSFSFEIWKPSIFCIEILRLTFDEFLEHKISMKMKSHGYRLRAKTPNTGIFELRDTDQDLR